MGGTTAWVESTRGSDKPTIPAQGAVFSTLTRGNHAFENRPIKSHQRMTEISPENNSPLSRQQWAHSPTEIEAVAPSPVQTNIWAFGDRPC